MDITAKYKWNINADIIEVYELVKVGEVQQTKAIKLTKEELIKLAEEKYGCKVVLKEEN